MTEQADANPFACRFVLDRERDGFTIYAEMEPMLAFASLFMEQDKFHRFELGVRRAADEMRDQGSEKRRPWWKR